MLASQFPLLVAYLVGLRFAIVRRTEQPRAAQLALWAFVILLLDEVVGNLVTSWLITSLNSAAATSSVMGSSGQLMWLNSVGVARMLLHTLAIALLIRALFPPRPNAVAASWVRWVVGALLGLIVGALLGMMLGDAIGAALNISAFEGGRGYFVIFVVIPGLALLGAIGGALVGGLTGRR